MKYIDDYRDSAAARKLADHIARTATRPWTLMEVCGGQTHAIVRFGIDQFLPDHVTLVHGPGCPVCVTPVALIDAAIEIAQHPDVILCSFGDMLRVPGSSGNLLAQQAAGADVRVVYSPLDALTIAKQNPNKQVVHFAVGFETTAPAHALAVRQAHEASLENFSLLVSHVLVPPAIEAILGSDLNRVQGFLAAGHVCAIMGQAEYEPIAAKYKVPIVITGFEPIDILAGVAMCIDQLEQGSAAVENPYARAVQAQGNTTAKLLLREVFEVVPRQWRGIGEIQRSGLGLRPRYHAFDAARRFKLFAEKEEHQHQQCIAGEVLQGIKRPHDCPAFGKACTPDSPLGAPMVSDEGACAAYYRYRRVTVLGV